MSYTVLSRRYRSATFDDLVGQGHIGSTLKRAIETDRIAHAYLFCGTRGTGKTSTARIFAKALNCHSADGPVAVPCGECSSCKGIARGDDIDCLEIDAASNTQVEKTRELIENSQYRPANSRFKIYIIDEVHMLSKASFNALLKTLEEPPSHVKFILATTEPEKVLPTIHSRCQRYDFRNIPAREVAAHLANICKLEKVEAEPDALVLVAKAGGGSMRDSLSLLDRLLSAGEKKITVGLLEQLLGMPKAQVTFELVQAIGEGRPADVLKHLDTIIASGQSVDTLVTALIEHLRNLMLLATCGKEADLVDVPGLSIDALVEQARKFDQTVLVQDIVILEESRRSLKTSSCWRALLEATLVRLAMAEQFTQISRLIAGEDVAGGAVGQAGGDVAKKAVEQVNVAPVRAELAATAVVGTPAAAPVPAEGGGNDELPAVGKVWDGPTRSLGQIMMEQRKALAAKAAAEAKAAETTVAAEAPAAVEAAAQLEAVDEADLPQVWRSVLGHFRTTAGALHGLLVQGKLMTIGESQAVVGFPPGKEFFVSSLGQTGKREAVAEALTKTISRPVGVKFEIDASVTAEVAEEPTGRTERPAASQPGPGRPAAKAAAPAAMPEVGPTALPLTEDLKRQLLDDPMLKGAMELFEGTIVRVTEAGD
jgi:DNA polymerase-3 subunit gamma/tau